MIASSKPQLTVTLFKIVAMIELFWIFQIWTWLVSETIRIFLADENLKLFNDGWTLHGIVSKWTEFRLKL